MTLGECCCCKEEMKTMQESSELPLLGEEGGNRTLQSELFEAVKQNELWPQQSVVCNNDSHLLEKSPGVCRRKGKDQMRPTSF